MKNERGFSLARAVCGHPFDPPPGSSRQTDGRWWMGGWPWSTGRKRDSIHSMLFRLNTECVCVYVLLPSDKAEDVDEDEVSDIGAAELSSPESLPTEPLLDLMPKDNMADITGLRTPEDWRTSERDSRQKYPRCHRLRRRRCLCCFCDDDATTTTTVDKVAVGSTQTQSIPLLPLFSRRRNAKTTVHWREEGRPTGLIYSDFCRVYARVFVGVAALLWVRLCGR